MKYIIFLHFLCFSIFSNTPVENELTSAVKGLPTAKEVIPGAEIRSCSIKRETYYCSEEEKANNEKEIQIYKLELVRYKEGQSESREKLDKLKESLLRKFSNGFYDQESCFTSSTNFCPLLMNEEKIKVGNVPGEKCFGLFMEHPKYPGVKLFQCASHKKDLHWRVINDITGEEIGTIAKNSISLRYKSQEVFSEEKEGHTISQTQNKYRYPVYDIEDLDVGDQGVSSCGGLRNEPLQFLAKVDRLKNWNLKEATLNLGDHLENAYESFYSGSALGLVNIFKSTEQTVDSVVSTSKFVVNYSKDKKFRAEVHKQLKVLAEFTGVELDKVLSECTKASCKTYDCNNVASQLLASASSATCTYGVIGAKIADKVGPAIMDKVSKCFNGSADEMSACIADASIGLSTLIVSAGAGKAFSTVGTKFVSVLDKIDMSPAIKKSLVKIVTTSEAGATIAVDSIVNQLPTDPKDLMKLRYSSSKILREGDLGPNEKKIVENTLLAIQKRRNEGKRQLLLPQEAQTTVDLRAKKAKSENTGQGRSVAGNDPRAEDLSKSLQKMEVHIQPNQIEKTGKMIESADSKALANLDDGAYIYIVDTKGRITYSKRYLRGEEKNLATHPALLNRAKELDPEVDAAAGGEFYVYANEAATITNKSGRFRGGEDHLKYSLEKLENAGLDFKDKNVGIKDFSSEKTSDIAHASESEIASFLKTMEETPGMTDLMKQFEDRYKKIYLAGHRGELNGEVDAARIVDYVFDNYDEFDGTPALDAAQYFGWVHGDVGGHIDAFRRLVDAGHEKEDFAEMIKFYDRVIETKFPPE